MGESDEAFEEEEKMLRIHTGNYILQTDVAKLIINGNCKKRVLLLKI